MGNLSIHTRWTRIVASLALIALAAFGAPACASLDPARETPGFERVASARSDSFHVRWTADESELPFNEHFSARLELASDSGFLQPILRARVLVSGGMPRHAHGMLSRPQVRELGNGIYTVDGLLFHMRGDWRLFIDLVNERGLRERATIEFEL